MVHRPLLLSPLRRQWQGWMNGWSICRATANDWMFRLSVRESLFVQAAERGAMKLKNISEEKGFSLQGEETVVNGSFVHCSIYVHCCCVWRCCSVLAATDDVIHPLLFACESRNPVLVQMALSSLQKPIQYNAIPEVLAAWCTCCVVNIVHSSLWRIGWAFWM